MCTGLAWRREVNMVPIVFVHGIWKDGSSFQRMATYLQQRGFKTYSIDLKPNNGSVPIECLSAQLSAFVEKIGSPVNLVAFSMGGLVARCYMQRMSGHKYVRKLITIGSPHHGTWAAFFSNSSAGRQMRVNSPWITYLNEDVGMLIKHDVASIWTPFDLLVVPGNSARLSVGHTIRVPVPMHHMLLKDQRVITAVEKELS